MNSLYTCTVVAYCADIIEDVCRIDRLCFNDTWLKRSFIEELNAACAVNLVAVAPDDADRVLGYCLGRVIADDYSIHRLAVHPDCQRRGIATRLLHSGMHAAALHGALNCFIEVRAGNTAALRLYTMNSFETIGTRNGYYHFGAEDAILMRCELGALDRISPTGVPS